MEEVKPHFNLGRKYPNRKKYFKGISIRTKFCLQCNTEYTPQYQNYQRAKFCSKECSAKRERPNAKGRICSPKIIEINKQRTGEKHPRWIKERTITIEKHRLRGTPEWSKWRESVFNRDNWTCKECSQVGGKIEPHHIVPLRLDIKKVFEINNGITLCRECHQKTIQKEELFIEKYQKILTIA